MSVDLSIIIPVFNSENYIVNCVNSIKIVGNINYEIIIVNDGSTDSSLKIINEISKDNKYIHIISQKNKGLGGARNTGILNSKGRYLIFLDSDDRLAISDFSNILSNDFDIMEFSVSYFDLDGNFVSDLRVDQSNLTLTGQDYSLKLGFQSSACNKIYNTNFIKKNSLFFKEQIYCEDIHFNVRAFYFAKEVSSIDLVLENIILTPNSITRSNNAEKKKKILDDLTFIFNDLLDFFSTHNFLKKDFSKKILGNLCLGIINISFKQSVNPIFFIEFFKKNKLVKYSYDFKKNIYKFFIYYRFLSYFLNFYYSLFENK